MLLAEALLASPSGCPHWPVAYYVSNTLRSMLRSLPEDAANSRQQVPAATARRRQRQGVGSRRGAAQRSSRRSLSRFAEGDAAAPKAASGPPGRRRAAAAPAASSSSAAAAARFGASCEASPATATGFLSREEELAVVSAIQVFTHLTRGVAAVCVLERHKPRPPVVRLQMSYT